MIGVSTCYLDEIPLLLSSPLLTLERLIEATLIVCGLATTAKIARTPPSMLQRLELFVRVTQILVFGL
jgi:hypothetical protein